MAEHVWTVMVTYQLSPEEAELADAARQRGELRNLDALALARWTPTGPGCVVCRQEWIECHDLPCPGEPAASPEADDPRETSGSGIVELDSTTLLGDSRIDTRNATLIDKVDFALVGLDGDGEPEETGVAMAISGRLNKTPARVTNLYLMGASAAAVIVAEIMALSVQIGPEFRDMLMARLAQVVADALLDSLEDDGSEGDGAKKSDSDA